MKLLNRTQNRTLLRRRGQPAYSPWSDWQVCEGAENLSKWECTWLILEWSQGDRLEWLNADKTHCRVQGPYDREEYRIVPDDYTV